MHLTDHDVHLRDTHSNYATLVRSIPRTRPAVLEKRARHVALEDPVEDPVGRVVVVHVPIEVGEVLLAHVLHLEPLRLGVLHLLLREARPDLGRRACAPRTRG